MCYKVLQHYCLQLCSKSLHHRKQQMSLSPSMGFQGSFMTQITMSCDILTNSDSLFNQLIQQVCALMLAVVCFATIPKLLDNCQNCPKIPNPRSLIPLTHIMHTHEELSKIHVTFHKKCETISDHTAYLPYGISLVFFQWYLH